MTLGRKVISHELVTGSSFIFLGTIVANIFAFLFNLFLVRHFNYVEYGEFAALLSLVTLVSIPAQSIQTILVRFSSDHLAKKDYSYASSLLYKSTKYVGFFSILLVLIGFICSPFLGNFLHIHDFPAIIFAGLALVSMYLTVPNVAFLQSLLRFQFLALTTALGGILKFAVGILFIDFGFHVAGAFAGIFFSFLIPFLITYIPLKFIFQAKQKDVQFVFQKTFQYAIPTTITIICLSAFTSADVILVKHFFPGDKAGLYAGLSLIGKIIFYFTAPIATVMFPLVIKRYEKKENFHSLFYVALLLVSIPSIFLTIFYFLFPQFVITVFLGGKEYLKVAPYLGWYGLYLYFFSVLNVIVNFFLSLKKTNIVWIIAIGAIMQSVLITFFHFNFVSIIAISTIIVLVSIVLLLVYYMDHYEEL